MAGYAVCSFAMRFGLFFQVSESAGQTQAERFAEMFDLVVLAESLGFDVAYLAELHFGGAFSLLSHPLMVVPAIAARTRRIRIGTAVTLLPLHHPLQVAEQAATADLLSGGRLEFGVGRGSIPTQFHGFRIPSAENRARFDEALEIIRLAWTEERFSYAAASTTSTTSRSCPGRCSARIRPSAWACIPPRASPTSVTRAGRSTRGPRPRRCRSCASAWRSTGRIWRAPAMPGAEQMALMFPMHIGATAGGARDAMRPGVLQYYRNVETIFSQLPDSYGEHLPRLKGVRETLANLPYEKFCRDQAMFGDSSEIVDRLQAAREEFGLSQIIGWFDQGSRLPRDEVERSMRRFAETVMPKLA